MVQSLHELSKVATFFLPRTARIGWFSGHFAAWGVSNSSSRGLRHGVTPHYFGLLYRRYGIRSRWACAASSVLGRPAVRWRLVYLLRCSTSFAGGLESHAC